MKATAELMVFLLRFWVVLNRKLFPVTGYPDRLFLLFLGLFRQMMVYYLKLGHDRFLQHPFQLISLSAT
jgi:hypothetical protein